MPGPGSELVSCMYGLSKALTIGLATYALATLIFNGMPVRGQIENKDIGKKEQEGPQDFTGQIRPFWR